MQTLEITAKTLEDAKQAAAEKLGVPAERVNVTVLEEVKGLFGKSSVRVRAEVEPEAPAATPEPTPVETLNDMQGAVDPLVDVRESGRRRRGNRRDDKPAAKAPASSASNSAPAGSDAPVSEPASGTDSPADEREETVANAADAEDLKAIVVELLDAAGMQVDVKVGEISGRYANLILDGKDVAFLVGKHGEVLNALQYLVNIVAGRRLERNVRATLDGNDYRRRREEALTQLATQIADQVRERGEEAVLDALPAFERRIVHKALSVLEGVTTYSEGEEPNRRVVIAPAD